MYEKNNLFSIPSSSSSAISDYSVQLKFNNYHSYIFFLKPKFSRMEAVLKHLKENEQKWVDRLAECVSIASISGSPDHRDECIRQMHETQKMLKALGKIKKIARDV
jgi:hypothetical protein